MADKKQNYAYSQRFCVGIPFSELIFDPGFIGSALAPALILFAVAVLGWVAGKIIKPLRSYASWMALATAGAIFLALFAGLEIGNKRLIDSSTQSMATTNSQRSSSSIDQAPIAQKNVAQKSNTQQNVASQLLMLSAEINGSTKKTLGDHLTILQAIANDKTLDISLRMVRYSRGDVEIQSALANFETDITKYYCGSNPYNLLLKRGANISIQLYEKNGALVETYVITAAHC